MLIIGAIFFTISHLAERWLGAWADEFLLSHNSTLSIAVAGLVGFMARHPFWSMFAFSIAVILAHLVHAYWATHPFHLRSKQNQTIESSAKQKSQPDNALPLNKNEPVALSNAPSIVLEYHWRYSNDTGHADSINMPLLFRNLGKEAAINVRLEIRYQKWIAKFPTIPHLAPSESKSAVVNLDYDGYDLAGLSADNQFISVIKPPMDDAFEQSRQVPAVVKYQDIHGNDFVSEYEFRWDHKKREAAAFLMRYGRTILPKEPSRRPILAGDPTTFLSFTHKNSRGLPTTFKSTYDTKIRVENTGRRDALSIQIRFPTLRTGAITFPAISRIAEKSATTILADVSGPGGQDIAPFLRHDISEALREEWESYKDPMKERLEIICEINYEDAQQNKFLAEITIAYLAWEKEIKVDKSVFWRLA